MQLEGALAESEACRRRFGAAIRCSLNALAAGRTRPTHACSAVLIQRQQRYWLALRDEKRHGQARLHAASQIQGLWRFKQTDVRARAQARRVESRATEYAQLLGEYARAQRRAKRAHPRQQAASWGSREVGPATSEQGPWAGGGGGGEQTGFLPLPPPPPPPPLPGLNIDPAETHRRLVSEALRDLGTPRRKHLLELRSYIKPPELVRRVLDCVCVMLGAPIGWESAKLQLSDPMYLVERLTQYDTIPPPPPPTLRRAEACLQHNSPCTAAEMETVCPAAKWLCLWCWAVVEASQEAVRRSQRRSAAMAASAATRRSLASTSSPLVAASAAGGDGGDGGGGGEAEAAAATSTSEPHGALAASVAGAEAPACDGTEAVAAVATVTATKVPEWGGGEEEGGGVAAVAAATAPPRPPPRRRPPRVAEGAASARDGIRPHPPATGRPPWHTARQTLWHHPPLTRRLGGATKLASLEPTICKRPAPPRAVRPLLALVRRELVKRGGEGEGGEGEGEGEGEDGGGGGAGSAAGEGGSGEGGSGEGAPNGGDGAADPLDAWRTASLRAAPSLGHTGWAQTPGAMLAAGKAQAAVIRTMLDSVASAGGSMSEALALARRAALEPPSLFEPAADQLPECDRSELFTLDERAALQASAGGGAGGRQSKTAVLASLWLDGGFGAASAKQRRMQLSSWRSQRAAWARAGGLRRQLVGALSEDAERQARRRAEKERAHLERMRWFQLEDESVVCIQHAWREHRRRVTQRMQVRTARSFSTLCAIELRARAPCCRVCDRTARLSWLLCLDAGPHQR